MKRISSNCLAWSAIFSMVFAGAALARPFVNGASIETRTFNDCQLSTVTVTNNYPALISITDAMDPGCVGFANLHSWSFSEDGGTTAAVFNNNSNFHFGADFKIDGAGTGEGGLRVSPWYGQYVDGRFMANATTGEIACFGGAIPFYSFTANHGITYTKGTTIHMEVTYLARDLFKADPASIQYRVIYNGNTYDSPVLPFGEQNTNECNPHGLWGMLNDGRVGSYFQPRANTGASLTATWTNITYQQLPPVGTPVPDGAYIALRTFNDCPLSTVTANNNYPSSIEITDAMNPACVGFANLHSWSFSDNGGDTAAAFHNNSIYHFGADFKINGAGEGEGGLRISPWYGQYVDGRFMANATTGEIACFGGALPFYSFTGNHSITYVKGTTIHLEATYKAHDLISTDPATIQYRVVYNGNTYDSPVLLFGEQNKSECYQNGTYHSLWGMLNEGRVGGYFQPRANTGASLTATWTDITFTSCVEEVAAAFHPHTLNLNSSGQYVTVTLTPTPPASPADIDVSSIRLNGSVAVAPGAPVQISGGSLTVKFDRSEVEAILSPGNAVPITISGNIAKGCFEATDVIRVKSSTLSHPAAGSVVASGSSVDLEWGSEPDAATVSVIASFDNGATWSVEADGIGNTGSYRWTVPDVTTDQARVAVVQIFSTDQTGIVTNSEISESGTFSISAALGVGDGSLAFALRGVSPNPGRGAFTVTLSLPSARPATLALFDVSGRQVLTRVVVGAGLHGVRLGQRESLRPGVYLVRLTQERRSVTARAVVIE